MPVEDPYRWLEDGDSPEVHEWVAAQNARTRAVLDALPRRAALHARFLDLLGAGTSVAPAVAGGRVFTTDRWGGRDQAVLVVRNATRAGGRAPDDGARVVIDPHALLGDDTAALDWYHPSPDGRLVAFGVSSAGDERSTLRIVDVDSGALLADVIPDTRAASVAWLPDASAFGYTRYPPGSDTGRAVWWHVVGDDPARDELVLPDDDDPSAWPDVSLSADGRWLVLHVSRGWTRTDVTVVDRTTGAHHVVIEGADVTTSAEVVDGQLWAVTTLDAPRGRIVRAAAGDPGAERWETVVPEGDDVIEGFVVAGASLLVPVGRHATTRLLRYDCEGRLLGEVELPELGTLAGLDAEHGVERAFLSFTGFTRPPGLWRWTPDGGLERWSEFEPVLDPDEFVVEQVFYPSTDDVRIPMFLVRARTTAYGQDTPTVLSGYGGFAVSSSPAWAPGAVAWCEAGGVYAVACIRGGNEYGEAWHRAGMLGRKQQVFDDFAAAAAWLYVEQRTHPDVLAIRGGSNGGLLVGATLAQRPDLCRAAVCAVPLLDMLRYHRFLIGALWVPEYGDPDDPEAFRWLQAYSPYHHVDEGVPYPAVLLLTAESDSRVDPLHARKFAARLQAATSSGDDQPVLLRVEPRAGHGVGKPVGKQADELADTWGFVAWQLGL